jgi:hypothetical protein
MDKVALTHTHAAYHLTFASFQRLHLTLHPYVTSKQAHSFTAPSCLHPRLEHGAVDQRRRYHAPQFNLHPARPAFSPSSSLFPHTRRDKPDRSIPFLSTRNEKCTEAPSLSLSLGEIERSPALVLYMDVADIRIKKWEDIDTWTSSRLPSLGLI